LKLVSISKCVKVHLVRKPLTCWKLVPHECVHFSVVWYDIRCFAWSGHVIWHRFETEWISCV